MHHARRMRETSSYNYIFRNHKYVDIEIQLTHVFSLFRLLVILFSYVYFLPNEIKFISAIKRKFMQIHFKKVIKLLLHQFITKAYK